MMDIKSFKQLMLQLDEELKINEKNLEQKSMAIPLIYHQYLDIYSKELRHLRKLELEKKKEYAISYEKVKHKSNVSWETKTEIESQVYNDPSFYSKCVEYNEQETMVNQLELSLKNIQNMSYQIKNIIEWRKLFGTM
jgi:hypothetical protein